MTGMAHPRFVLLVYRMPAKPTAARVAVWRMLKKVGAIYLQQSVCLFPDIARLRRELQPIRTKIEDAGGEFHFLPVHGLAAEERQKLVDQFLDQTSKHYSEIIENCEVNFQKEIEFEIFRANFTYEEAEEIRTEFEKIVEWFHRVTDRDWFGAPLKVEAEQWLIKCEHLVEDFEARVFAAQETENPGRGRTVKAALGSRSGQSRRSHRSPESVGRATMAVGRASNTPASHDGS
jgi:hypothetical protein